MSERVEWLNAYKDVLNLGYRNVAIGFHADHSGLLGYAEWFEDSRLEAFYQGFVTCHNLMRVSQIQSNQKMHNPQEGIDFDDGSHRGM